MAEQEVHRLGTYVRINLTNETMSKVCLRAEMEGIRPNEKGYYPMEAIGRALFESYADGTYVILKNSPKRAERSTTSGADYMGDKKAW